MELTTVADDGNEKIEVTRHSVAEQVQYITGYLNRYLKKYPLYTAEREEFRITQLIALGTIFYMTVSEYSPDVQKKLVSAAFQMANEVEKQNKKEKEEEKSSS